YDGTEWTPVPGLPSSLYADLYDIWGSPSAGVFAVGVAGIILHYDEATDWEIMTTPVDVGLESICGSATGIDVYVFGENGTILHYGN
ncbi:MAG: WD40 repeat domain-containing protein, partial [Spirochaetales bacterium]|nr:WD40 repeat domain-containing protein [Spirochaetales bacterium]